METTEEAIKLETIKKKVESELKDIQRKLNIRKRVDQTEAQLPDLWSHKMSLKRVLECIEEQTGDRKNYEKKEDNASEGLGFLPTD